jgi:hypothetical protein
MPRRRHARSASEDEMLQRRIYIRGLHAAGFPRQEILRLASEKLTCSSESVAYVLDGVRKDLRVEAERQAPENHAAALERAYTDLVNTRLDVQVLRQAAVKNWPAIQAGQRNILLVERFIAELEGTLRPTKVEVGVVGVSDALQRLLVAMTPEQIERAVIEERERLRDHQAVLTTALEPSAPPSLPALPSPTPSFAGGRRPKAPAPRAADRVDRSPQGVSTSNGEGVGPAPHVDQRLAARSVSVRVVS